MNERELLLQIADDELVVGWRDSEWTGIAPFLEEDVALSSIAQNEIGHARAIYELLADDADALAFDRPPGEYACSQLVELRLVPDWARTIARHYLYERADERRIKELMESGGSLYGMQTFEMHVKELVREGLVDREIGRGAIGF